jgi:nicotinamidase-related amidase
MRGRIPWQAGSSRRYAIEEWEIEGRATALVLLDLQIAHLDPDRGAGPSLWARFPAQAGYYYERVSTQVLPAAIQLLAFFRQHRLPIVHCHSGLALPGGRDVAAWSWRAATLKEAWRSIPLLLPPGAADREPHPELEPLPGELTLVKPTLSPFNSTALDQYLRNMGVENLVLAGVLSNGAVETTARAAGDRGYTAIVTEDACAALSPEDHAACVRSASWYVTKSSAAILAELMPLVSA